jgi:hypothetical protein
MQIDRAFWLREVERAFRKQGHSRRRAVATASRLSTPELIGSLSFVARTRVIFRAWIQCLISRYQKRKIKWFPTEDGAMLARSVQQPKETAGGISALEGAEQHTATRKRKRASTSFL